MRVVLSDLTEQVRRDRHKMVFVAGPRQVGKSTPALQVLRPAFRIRRPEGR